MNIIKRIKIMVSGTKVGSRDSMIMGLDKLENWTPLLIYIHTTRILLGFVLGSIFGASLALSIVIHIIK